MHNHPISHFQDLEDLFIISFQSILSRAREENTKLYDGIPIVPISIDSSVGRSRNSNTEKWLKLFS